MTIVTVQAWIGEYGVPFTPPENPHPYDADAYTAASLVLVEVLTGALASLWRAGCSLSDLEDEVASGLEAALVEAGVLSS